MALPVTIPNTFANATSSIPLSQLDTNFSTLANAVNGLNSGSETLANLKATTANVGVLTVTGNATIGDASTDTVTLNSTLTANTAVIFAAGTSAAPSITTTGDTNTGIFFPAADTIAFAEGGAEAMRIDSSGNVLVGTTTSRAKLTVSQAKSGTGVESTNLLTLEPTGTFAIGDSANINFNNGNVTTGRISGIYGADATVYGSIAFAVRNYNTDSLDEALRINNRGNVGIGTTSPTDKLSVGTLGTGSNTIIIASSTTGTGALYYGDGTDADRYRGYIEYVHASDYMAFGTSATERARITSGGYFKASNSGSYWSSTSANHELRTNGNDWTALISSITSTAGNCYGIRIAYPNATPNSSTDNQFIYCDDSTNIKFTVYSNGTVTNRTGTYNSFSDLKLKQDVVDANSQWDDIKALRIVKYRLKDEVAADPNYPAYIGVIAQEVEQVSPGLVDNCPDFENVTKTREVEKTREVTPAVLDDEGNEVTPAVTETYTDIEEYTERVATGTVTKSVKYSILYMKAVKALQEAMERIEKLEAEVAALKGN